MPRGQPDFGALAAKEVTASISDMGEVAARLGSILIYDKRGDVVMFDNFEEPVLMWKGTAPGGYIRHSSYDARSGVQSVLLHTGAVLAEWASLERGVAVLASRKLGLEFSFVPHDNCYHDFYLMYYDGERRYFATARLDWDIGKLYVGLGSFPGDIEWTEIASGLKLYNVRHHWSTIKIVADFETFRYVRVLLNLSQYNVDSLCYTAPDDTAPHITANIQIVNKIAAENTVYYDDFILTQAEP